MRGIGTKASGDAAGRKTRLLIVDDEPTVARSIARALEFDGYEARVASGFDEAIVQIDAIDLLLTDMQMPGKTGLDLLLETQRRRPELPVAIMTAFASVENALSAMQQGAYDYLLKPCHTEEIILKVELGLRLSRYEHELKRRNAELERMSWQLAEQNEELERLATTDELTKLANRRSFLARVDDAVAQATRYGHPVALIMLDLDHFKRINDTYGHPRGDAVLVETAERLQRTVREVDLVGRLGGEEIGILLPNTDRDGALELAERIRECISGASYEEVGEVTVSAGVATLQGDASRMIAEADAALYEAKRGGRDRVVAAPRRAA